MHHLGSYKNEALSILDSLTQHFHCQTSSVLQEVSQNFYKTIPPAQKKGEGGEGEGGIGEGEGREGGKGEERKKNKDY